VNSSRDTARKSPKKIRSLPAGALLQFSNFFRCSPNEFDDFSTFFSARSSHFKSPEAPPWVLKMISLHVELHYTSSTTHKKNSTSG
jgi:hypothetical protein